jgi:hypothetical protein
MNIVSLVGLCKIELPAGDANLCDGGFIVFDSETYRSADALLGTIASIQPVSEGVGNEIPALEMVFLPPEATTPAEMVQPGWQTSRARFWIAEYDPEAGTITGTPDVVFDGQLDQSMLSVGASRELAVMVVSLAERLFERNTGNSLTSAFHKSVWPGELGHDNATGLNVQVAWGTANPQSAATSYTPTGPYHSPRSWREERLDI